MRSSLVAPKSKGDDNYGQHKCGLCGLAYTERFWLGLWRGPAHIRVSTFEAEIGRVLMLADIGRVARLLGPDRKMEQQSVRDDQILDTVEG